MIIASVGGVRRNATKNFSVKTTRTKRTLRRTKNGGIGTIGTDLREISVRRPGTPIFSHHFHTHKKNLPSYDPALQIINLEEYLHHFVIVHACCQHEKFCTDSLMG